MNVPRPTFERTITFGNVLTLAAMLACSVVAYTNFVSTVKDQQAAIETARSIAIDIRNAADVRAAKYIPMIEAQQRAGDLQDTRIQNLVTSVASLRDGVTELARSVAQTHEDMAVMKSRADREGTTRP